MSNSTENADGNVALRLGRNVIMVDAGAGHLVKGAGRQMRMTAGARSFLVARYNESLPDEIMELHDSLETFGDRLGLGQREVTAVAAELFRLVVPMFRLEAESQLLAIARQISDQQGLPRARVHADHVTGCAVIPLRLPAGMPAESGDVVFAISHQGLVVGGISGIGAVLAGEEPDQSCAALAVSLPADARTLVLLARSGPVRIELDVTDHDSVSSFMTDAVRQDPDAVSVLGVWDRDASIEIAQIARKSRILNGLDEPLAGFRFSCEVAAALGHGLFAAGWFYDPDNHLEQVTAIDHSLANPDVRAQWHLFDGRAEFDGEIVPVRRFVVFLPRREHHEALPLVMLRVVLRDGESHILLPGPRMTDLRSLRNAILNTIADHAYDRDLHAGGYAPALAPIHASIGEQQSVRASHEFGRRSGRTVSIIVPLYRELSFVRSQLAAFDADPFVKQHCEFVYVLDDPTIATATRTMLRGYGLIHELDIRLVVMSHNGGFGPANNFGVGEAGGDVLVLMNSDVVPAAPGWLEPLLARLEALPQYSVVGPKLLYADGSLQHAGMYFHPLVKGGPWQNMHYWKGYGRLFTPANMVREVPAVTGALMVLRAADYRAVGGFSPDYIVGDYEDSDLCLKLRQQGGTCWYEPTSALYHLERQSMPDHDGPGDRPSTIYNRALHACRWEGEISALMERFEQVHVDA